MFPTSTPQFINFLKKKKKTVWTVSQASSREWDGLVPDCPAVPHASCSRGTTRGWPGTRFSWEEACSDLMCLLNPSLPHRLWSHSSKPVTGVIPAVSLLGARKYLFQLFAEFRGHSHRRRACAGDPGAAAWEALAMCAVVSQRAVPEPRC